MRYLKFKVVTDEEFGEAGILCNIHKNWENYSPCLGVNGLAHDILDHGNREMGAFHQEAAAHGGFLFTRLLSGYVQNNYLSNAFAAISGFARSWNESITHKIAKPPLVILDKYDHEMLNEFLLEVRGEAMTEWEQENEYYDSDDPCPYTTDENWPKVCGWIKYGYARAKRRFKGDDYLSYRTFKSIGTVIDKEWPDLQKYADSDLEFTLVLNYENGQASIRRPWGY